MNKEEKIKEIQKIVEKWGSFNIGDINGEETILYLSFGKDHQVMIERINISDVDVTEYVHEMVVNEDSIEYEKLDEETIDDILLVCESYKLDNEESYDRTKN